MNIARVYSRVAGDIKGKLVGVLVRGGMLKSYTTQISHSTLFNKPTSV
jgi:hypothetical protein